MNYTLTSEAVDSIIRDCLYTDDEMAALMASGIPEGDAPPDAVLVEGITQKFGFHPARLESHREEVARMLRELPEQFQESKGGGWSFLNACCRADDWQWGEQMDAQALVALGLGLGLARYTLPRSAWMMLPGSVPYVTVTA